MRAILCLSEWTRLGLVKDEDIKAAALQPEQEGKETAAEVEVGWDDIVLPLDNDA